MQDGWSQTFADWIIPKVETFRADLEIAAVPVVEDFDRDVRRYADWKQRREKLRRIWFSGLMVLIGSFVLTLVLDALAPSLYADLSLLLRLLFVGGHFAFVVALMQYKGQSVITGLIGSFLCGLGILYAAFVADLNRLSEPVRPAHHDEKIRLLKKVNAILEAESGKA